MQYVICSSLHLECVNTFELKANRASANGIRQSGINTIQACKDRCSGMDTTQVCYGFDWNKVDNECWFHFTQAAIDRDFSDASSNQYAVNRCTCKYATVLSAYRTVHYSILINTYTFTL